MRLFLTRRGENEKRIIDSFLDIFKYTQARKIFGYDDAKETLFESGICQMYPLLRKLNQTSSKPFKRIQAKCLEMSTDVLPLTETRVDSLYNDEGHSTPFSYDASCIEDALYQHILPEDIDFIGYIEDSTYNGCFCSLAEQNPSEYVDEMPIEAISKWAKYVYLAGSELPFQSFIFNEAGHFIPQ